MRKVVNASSSTTRKKDLSIRGFTRAEFIFVGSGYERAEASSSTHEPRERRRLSVRRAESHPNLDKSDDETAHEMKRSTSSCRCGDSKNKELQAELARNLQQQIYFLEMENSYLKQNAKVTRIKDPREAPAYANGVRWGSGEVAMPGEWCRLPPSHPPIDRTRMERVDVDRRIRFDPSPPTVHVERTVERDAELLQRLEENTQRTERFQSEIRDRDRSIASLEERLTLSERKAKRLEEEAASRNGWLRETSSLSTADLHARDKRALMEEILELQRRLDDLTPMLAQKESHIAKLENERDAVSVRLRSAMQQLSSLQIKLDEKQREDAAMASTEVERRNELDRLSATLKSTTSELNDKRLKETALIEEVASLKRQLREEELRAKKDAAMYEKVMEENTRLIRENSQLSSEVTRFEMNLESARKELGQRRDQERNAFELFELRDSENALRDELSRCQERLRTEQERLRLMEAELRDRDARDGDTREHRSRVQRELEALQTLSKSLTAENKELRADVMNRDEPKEDEAHKLRIEFESVEKKYKETLFKYEEERNLELQRSREFEELSRRVKELSDSIPQGSPQRPARSAIPRRSPERVDSRASGAAASSSRVQRSTHSYETSINSKKIV